MVSSRSKQANIHMHVHNEVTLVWGSLRLAPIKVVTKTVWNHAEVAKGG